MALTGCKNVVDLVKRAQPVEELCVAEPHVNIPAAADLGSRQEVSIQIEIEANTKAKFKAVIAFPGC